MKNIYLDDKFVSSIMSDRSYISLIKHLKDNNIIKRNSNNEFTEYMQNNFIQLTVETEPGLTSDDIYAEFDCNGKTYSMIKQLINTKCCRFYMLLDEQVEDQDLTIRVNIL